MNLAAIIFDVDGTLAETERDGHRIAFNAAFAEAGLPWLWDEALYGRLLAVAGGKERIRHFVKNIDPATASRPDFAALVEKLHRTKTRHYVELVEAGTIPLRPGVASLIKEASASGLKLAIATTTSPENVSALLKGGLEDCFEVIGAGDIVPAKKPAPDIYRWVLSRLGLPAGACLAIEDSAIGLASSLACGIVTVVTPSDYSRGQDFTGAAAVLPDLAATDIHHLNRAYGPNSVFMGTDS